MLAFLGRLLLALVGLGIFLFAGIGGIIGVFVLILLVVYVFGGFSD